MTDKEQYWQDEMKELEKKAAAARRKENIEFMKYMLKSHEEWKAAHPRPKRTTNNTKNNQEKDGEAM